MCECVNECVSEWASECISVWVSLSVCGYVNEYVSEWASECIRAWVSTWVRVWVCAWASEWLRTLGLHPVLTSTCSPLEPCYTLFYLWCGDCYHLLIIYYKMKEVRQKDDSVGIALAVRTWKPEFRSQHPHEKPCMGLDTCKPSTAKRRSRGLLSFAGLQPCSGFKGRLCLKGVRQRAVGQNLWASHRHTLAYTAHADEWNLM